MSAATSIDAGTGSQPSSSPTAARAEANLPAPPSLRQRIWRSRMHYAFILPTILLLGIFAYFPAASAIYHSFFNWDGVHATWVGFANFVTIVTDPVMRQAFGNVLKLALFSVIVSVTVPLFVARMILTIKNPRLQYVFRVIFIIPLVMTRIVIYLIWQFFYDPNFGVLNHLLQGLHLMAPQAWLGDPTQALYAVMGIGFPWIDGFALLIFTAGLQNIPNELREAAAMDGANAWRRFRRIELPLVRGQIKLIATLSMIWVVQDFLMIFIVTQGGPGTATMVPGLALFYAAFQNNEMGYASAIGTIMFLIMLGLTFLNLRFMRSNEYDPAAKRRS